MTPFVEKACEHEEVTLFEERGQTMSMQEKQQAFSSFLGKHQDRLLGVAARLLRNRDDAFDVLQEVAIRIYKNWSDLDASNNIDGWLYRVTVNECYRWLRNKPKVTVDEQQISLDSLQAETRQQEEHLRTKQFQRFLVEALAELSEQERIAFVLRDIDQRSGKEIASIMDCQPTTARGYYFVARKKLATYIKEQAPEWIALLGGGAA